MNGGLSKLGSALIAVFALCLVILAADLAYVIWRRRRFHRRTSVAGDSVVSGDSSSIYVLSSKELLYFFCWKNQSRIEPNDHQANNTNGSGVISNDRDSENAAAETEDGDVLKLQEMYGQSRLLFTIEEEEENTTADQKSVTSDGQDQPEDQEFNDVTATEVTLTVDPDDHATPFSTPCASPPYYTPPRSPSIDEVKHSHESYGEAQFVSLKIIGV